MALLIDGYNLLHVTGIFGQGSDLTALHRSRKALLEFLAAAIDPKVRPQTTIVFDAAGAPPGLPRTIVHEGMTVHFSRGYADADAMIEELLEQHVAPRSILVVSSDHRVQRAARRSGAKTVDSDQWYGALRASRRPSGPARGGAPDKPTGRPSRDEVSHWVDEFDAPRLDDRPQANSASTDIEADQSGFAGGNRPNEDAFNPFPPGYGDDLLDGAD